MTEPDSPLASIGLAVVHAEQGKPAESVDEALNAIGQRYFWPEAHAQLGIALVRLGQIERAIQAFETSLAQRPTALAHGWLGVPLQQGRHRPLAESERLRQLRQQTGQFWHLPGLEPQTAVLHVHRWSCKGRNCSL